MARRVKALRNNKKGISPNHREHRSKKNRRRINKDREYLTRRYKRKKEELGIPPIEL